VALALSLVDPKEKKKSRGRKGRRAVFTKPPSFKSRARRLAIISYVLLQGSILEMALEEELSLSETLAVLESVGLGEGGAVGGIAKRNEHLLKEIESLAKASLA